MKNQKVNRFRLGQIIFRKLLLKLFLIGMSHGLLCAQTSVNLPSSLKIEDAVSIALKYHPSLRAAEASVQSADALLRQAQANFYPSLSLSAGGAHTEGAFVFNPQFPPRHQDYESYSAALQAQQILFDFNKTFPRVSANKFGLESVKFDYQATRALVATNVQLAYFRLMRAKSIVKVNEQTLQQAEQHVNRAKSFYAVGKRPRFDVTRAEVELANANVNMISARNQLQTARLQLENAMGIHAGNEYAVTDSLLIEPFALPLDSVKQIAQLQRAEFRAANLRLKSSRSSVTAARSQHLPTLIASGSYNWNGFDFPLRSRWSAGLTLSLPLFQGFAVSAQAQQAQANADAAGAAVDILQQQIMLDVEGYYLALQEAQQRTLAARKLREQALENLRLAEARYNSGAGSPIEITDAQVMLSNANITHIQALFDYNSSLAQLRRAMGDIFSDRERR